MFEVQVEFYGPEGCGKTTLMEDIKEALKDKYVFRDMTPDDEEMFTEHSFIVTKLNKQEAN